MDGDFFQLLRRIQREERSKSTLARVDKDFYKKLYSYIRALERSVARNPFDNNQSLLLSNAQMIASDICERRETKISNAANNNIYKSFHLFKKGNPQFDLTDTTPLNLTPEEETLYFSLMDALKTHRYNISLDKYSEDTNSVSSQLDYDDEDGDYADSENMEDSASYDDSILESRVNPGVVSEEEFFGDENGSAKDTNIVAGAVDSTQSSESVVTDVGDESIVTDGFSGESIPDEASSTVYDQDNSGLNAGETIPESNLASDKRSNVELAEDSSDEVMGRLKQIQNATVVEDEQYEPIEKQINNQANVVPNVSMENNLNFTGVKTEEESKEGQKSLDETSKPSRSVEAKPAGVKPAKPFEERPKPKSSSTLDFDSIFANPDSQFDNISNFEHDYEADFANIEASAGFAQPSEADLMFSTKQGPKKEKAVETHVGSKPIAKPKKESKIKSLAKKDEIKNTAVMIFNDMGSIVGIDEKVYGPFTANDVVILPNLTAQILIDNNKAELIDI